MVPPQMPALLLALLLHASPEGSLAEAERAYVDGRYDRVRPLVDEALTGLLTPADRLRALGLSAFTWAAFDDSKAAVAAFGQALDLDPRWEPAGRMSPKVRGLFEEARREKGRPAFLPPEGAKAATPTPTGESPAPAMVDGPSIFSRPWFWVAASVVVAGGVTGGVLLSQPHLPRSDLPVGTLR